MNLLFPRALRRGDARRLSELQTDAVPVEPAEGRADPEAERRGRVRRAALWLALAAICLSGFWAAVFGERGLLDLMRSRGEQERLEAETAARLERVRELREEVRRLESDPAALERLARDELGLGRPGERHFLLPPSGEAPGAGLNRP